MALKQLTPIHFAIATIDQTIADLQRRKRELQAQLPAEEFTCKKVAIIDPRKAGKKKSH